LGVAKGRISSFPIDLRRRPKKKKKKKKKKILIGNKNNPMGVLITTLSHYRASV